MAVTGAEKHKFLFGDSPLAHLTSGSAWLIKAPLRLEQEVGAFIERKRSQFLPVVRPGYEAPWHAPITTESPFEAFNDGAYCRHRCDN